MKSGRTWTEKLLQGIQLQEETLPRQSILELCNDRRVLIENHMGVLEYSLERICVKVRFGSIQVVGCGLQLRKMEGQMLVITGSIRQIYVNRGHI